MIFIKRIIFHLLLAMRGIILGISKLFAFLFIIGFILMIIFVDFKTAPTMIKITILTLGILFTLINWLYDYVVFYFEHEDIEVKLYK